MTLTRKMQEAVNAVPRIFWLLNRHIITRLSIAHYHWESCFLRKTDEVLIEKDCNTVLVYFNATRNNRVIHVPVLQKRFFPCPFFPRGEILSVTKSTFFYSISRSSIHGIPILFNRYIIYGFREYKNRLIWLTEKSILFSAITIKWLHWWSRFNSWRIWRCNALRSLFHINKSSPWQHVDNWSYQISWIIIVQISQSISNETSDWD